MLAGEQESEFVLFNFLREGVNVMQSKNFIVIHGWMINELNLKGNDLLVYALIYGFSQTDNQYYTGSLDYLAEWCNSTKQGIIKNLENLLSKDLIVKEQLGYNKYRWSTKFNTMVNKVDHDGKQSLPNNIARKHLVVDKSTTKANKESKEEIVQDFLNLYHTICKSLPKVKSITDKRKKAIKKLMNTYTLNDAKEVFTKAEESSFLTGKNDRGWKADIDFILREDKFISILEGKYDCKSKSKSNFDTYDDERKKVDKIQFREEIKNGKSEKF